MPIQSPPNIVFILTDDQGPWAMGCAGNEEIRTPNLDRLARSGVRLSNFHCTSPICSAARASLLTGKIPSQHGVHDFISGGNMPPAPQAYLAGLTAYTDILAAHGYLCGLSGKWHLGDSLTPQCGFSHWFALPQGLSTYENAPVIRDGKVVKSTGYLTDVITDDALAFIQANQQRPFYLSVHYNAPHAPWWGHPQEIVDSYDSCPFKSCPQEAPHPWARLRSKRYLGDRDALKAYFAAVTAMDLGVGRIIDRLDKLALRQNTLLIFASDNGFSCGHHGFWHKGNGTFPLNMYDSSVKVPAIFSHPGHLPQNLVSPALLSQYDVLPTLLDYLHLPASPDPALPGKTFLPILEGKTDSAQEHVVVYDEYGPVRMIRTPQWKYVHRFPYGPHELYEMILDPEERHNLVDDKSRQAVVVEMRNRLVRWFDRYVVPQRDGAHCPVYGDGQIRRIDADTPGESAFVPLDDTLFPQRATVRPQGL